MPEQTQFTQTATNPKTGERVGWNGKQWVPIPKAIAAASPAPMDKEGASERFVHAAGFPARPSEIPEVIWNIIAPEASKTSPGFGQTLPLVGPLFRAQRETYEQPGAEAKIFGSIPVVGPIAYAGGKALEKGDYATAGGSLLNALMMLYAARGKAPVPGAIEKPAVPYTPEAQVKPGVAVLGAPRGFLASRIAARFGLRPDLADQVSKRVEEIQGARKAAETEIRGSQRRAQAASTSLAKAGEREVAGVRQVSEFAQQTLTKAESDVIGQLEKQISGAKAQRAGAGEQLIRDTAKAAWEESQRVKAPFEEIGEAIREPATTGVIVRKLVNDSVKQLGGRVEEIPGRAFNALPSGEASSVRVGGMTATGPLPQAILDILTPEERGESPVSFNDLTRVREDLYGAASATKDTTIRRGLYQAADKITDMQQQIADQHGLGDKYKLAKTEYKLFRRGIGSPMMEKMLAAEDARQQAIVPKLAKLSNKATESAIRTVLRSVGVDTAEFDRLGEYIVAREGELKQVPKEAKAESSRLALEEKARTAGIESGVREGIAGVEKVARQRQAQVASEAKQTIKVAQKAGADIVPGYTSEQLAGMTNEQLKRLRLERIIGKTKKLGLNPYALFQIMYGLARIASYSPVYGAYHVLYGAGEAGIPSLLRSPRFQDWVIRNSGGIPESPAGFKLRQGLNELSKTIPAAVAQERRQQ